MLMNDILKIEQKRTEIKKEIYKNIFEQFTRKIRHSAELGQKQAIVQVPAFLFGFPTFDRAKATDYLKRQLVISGFEVSKIGEFELYVSWAKTKPKKEIRPDEQELPNLANLRKLAVKYGAAPHKR